VARNDIFVVPRTFIEASAGSVVGGSCSCVPPFIHRPTQRYGIARAEMTTGGNQVQQPKTVLRRDGAGPIHNVLGMRHEYKLLASESGQFMSMIVTVPQGCGAPMHHHDRDSESFYVLEGEITLINGDGSRTVAGPGDYVWFAAGHEHAFLNEGETPARAAVTHSPGLDAEQFFAGIDEAMSGDRFDPANDIVELGAQHGVRIAKVPELA